jgi:hypothetical protein
MDTLVSFFRVIKLFIFIVQTQSLLLLSLQFEKQYTKTTAIYKIGLLYGIKKPQPLID